MEERIRFRLIQDGIPVAWTEGNRAQGEMMHYAAVYAKDGPVKIQKHERGKWRPWPPRTLFQKGPDDGR